MRRPASAPSSSPMKRPAAEIDQNDQKTPKKRPAAKKEESNSSKPRAKETATPKVIPPKKLDFAEATSLPLNDGHESAEEEEREHDPEIEASDANSKKRINTKNMWIHPKNVSPAKRPAVKGESRRGEIVSTVDLNDGWKLLTHRTPTGRQYKKWLHPNGKDYWFSRVQALEHGLKD